ncbi:Hypothetical Protein FCC1311_085222 [Hondaea fermentalgiana]|uniref:Uncharacterized protein n=1 Tax=Hondaea fermentalgiana TaxID=2315210 RepID=A0A2R5GN26_9STRA|nr:Hypothetical Protein FCC1311_085222 [Hondaea fermentalgiana]|eukprot:GBG32297.1 Hypothetical Protein FCC1311_085222 [Hondaea fermentalgiana]
MAGGDRASWLGKEAKVNGLFAANVMPKRRKHKNKVLPSSHALSDGAQLAASQVEGELAALRNIVSEEGRMKDKLLDAMGERCSKAEARIEEVLREKARVERDLEAAKYSLQEKTSSEREIAELEAALEQANAKVSAARTAASEKERTAAELQRKVSQLEQAHARVSQGQSMRTAHLEEQVETLQRALDETRDVAQAQLAAARENEQVARKSENAHSQLAGTVEELQEERDGLKKAMQKLLADNEQLRTSNRTLLHRAEESEAALENAKRRVSSHADKYRDQERLCKEATEAASAAEAKSARLADQLKASQKKASFLVKKADAAQDKLVAKEKEVLDLAEKLESLNKKYRMVRERLEYVKHTSGVGSNGCNDTSALRKSNNHEEDPDSSSGNPSASLPGVRPGGRRGSSPTKASTRSSTTASALGSTTGRHEDQSTTAKPAAARASIEPQAPSLVDPALASDSDAPAWMRF